MRKAFTLVLFLLILAGIFLVLPSVSELSATGAVVSTFQCADSDGGKAYEIKGAVTTERLGAVRTYEDVCSSVGVKEYYCGDRTVKRIVKKCICVQSACTGNVPSTVP